MTVSHLTRSRDQLWSDLLVALGGSEAFLSRSISERRILLEIMETFSVTVSTKDIDDLDELLEQLVIAAGGTASHLRQNKHEMLAALVTALGGTPPSSSSSSTGELLAACVNAVDTGGGGGGYEGPLDIVTAVVAYSQRALSAAMLGQSVISVNAQAFSSDADTGAEPNAEIVSFLNGSPGFVTRFNNQGSFGSSFDLSHVGGNGYEWVADLLNGHCGLRAGTPYADNTTFIDGLPTHNITLPMTIFAVVGNNINTGIESTDVSSQSVFDSNDDSFDTFLQGFTTEAGISLTTPVSGIHLLEASVGAAGQTFRVDGVLQTDFSYSYGHGAESIPVNGAWIGNDDAGAIALEIILSSGAISDADMTSVRQNIASYYGITLG